MSEQPPNIDRVKFSWSAEEQILCIQVWFEDARLHLDFKDDGSRSTRNMQKIVSVIPIVLKTIRQEEMIKRETDEIDGDLRTLLDDGDSDE